MASWPNLARFTVVSASVVNASAIPAHRAFRLGLALSVMLVCASPARSNCAAPSGLAAKLRTQPTAENYVQAGLWFGNHRQFDCALNDFRRALKLKPNSPKILYLIGLTAYTSGQDGEEAAKALTESIRLDPNNLDSHLILASVLMDMKRAEDAAGEWLAALRIDPKSEPALDGLSKDLIAAGNYGAAIAILSSAPRDETLALDLATAYVKADRTDDAADVLNEALRAKPASLPLRRALITVYVEKRWVQQAAKVAELAAKLNPGNLQAQELHLHVLILNGDMPQARALGPKLLREAPHDFETLYLNGVLEREAGDNATARKHLEQALAIQPNHANAHFNLGVCLEALGDPKDAAAHLQKAIDLGEQEPAIRFELAKALRAQGETQKAQEELKLYQQELLAKANRTLAASKSAEAAQALEKGNVQEAVQLYRDAVAALPTNEFLQYKLALALDRAADRDGERAALEQAVKIDPAFALAQHQLGYLDSLGGDFASAEKHFRSAAQAAPGYTQAWISLAATLGMESQFPQAKEAVAMALRLEPHNKDAQELQRELSAAAEAKH